MISKSGSAVWTGNLRDGSGRVSTQSGALDGKAYSFAKRFGDEAGTNPEELLGAAHASCFAMALSNILGERDLVADEIKATSTMTLDPASLLITKAHLEVVARVPDASAEEFADAAQAAKEGCPVSKLYNAEITMDARLA